MLAMLPQVSETPEYWGKVTSDWAMLEVALLAKKAA